MELPLRLQAAQFAAALLFGLLCGVVYDLPRAKTPHPRADRPGGPAVRAVSAAGAAGAGALCWRREAAAVLLSRHRARCGALFPRPQSVRSARAERGAGRCRAGFAAFALAGTKIFENFPYFFQKVLCKCEKMVYNIR